MKRTWMRIEVLCVPDLGEELAAEIAEVFGVGVEILQQGVRFYLEEDRFLSGAQETMARTLRDFMETWGLETLPACSIAVDSR